MKISNIILLLLIILFLPIATFALPSPATFLRLGGDLKTEYVKTNFQPTTLRSELNIGVGIGPIGGVFTLYADKEKIYYRESLLYSTEMNIRGYTLGYGPVGSSGASSYFYAFNSEGWYIRDNRLGYGLFYGKDISTKEKTQALNFRYNFNKVSLYTLIFKLPKKTLFETRTNLGILPYIPPLDITYTNYKSKHFYKIGTTYSNPYLGNITLEISKRPFAHPSIGDILSITKGYGISYSKRLAERTMLSLLYDKTSTPTHNTHRRKIRYSTVLKDNIHTFLGYGTTTIGSKLEEERGSKTDYFEIRLRRFIDRNPIGLYYRNMKTKDLFTKRSRIAQTINLSTSRELIPRKSYITFGVSRSITPGSRTDNFTTTLYYSLERKPFGVRNYLTLEYYTGRTTILDEVHPSYGLTIGLNYGFGRPLDEIIVPLEKGYVRVYGSVFNDINMNNKRDKGEEAIPNIEVMADDMFITYTDKAGRYSFRDLPPGKHKIKIRSDTIPAEYILLEDELQSIEVAAFREGVINFEVTRPGQVTGRVFVDENMNGIYDKGERPVRDIRIVIDDVSTFTDEAGKYTFYSAPPGKRVVEIDRESIPPYYTLITPQKIEIIVYPQKEVTGVDFGLYRLDKKYTLSYFDTNGYTIKRINYYVILNEIIELIKENPECKVIITGHTDNQEKEETGEKRANTVFNYFIEKGIDKKYFQLINFGSKNPAASNETEEGRAFNRRVEIYIKF